MATRRKKTVRRKPSAKRSARKIKRNAPSRRMVRRPAKHARAAKRPLRIARKAVKAAVKAVRKPKAERRSGRFLADQHVRNLLLEIAGEKALKVAGELTEPMSDEQLAGAAKIKLSETRAVLNKLHAVGIAAYARTRNNEGWYTYTWGLTLEKAKEILDERNAEARAAVQARLSDVSEYYACPNCFERTKARMKFEQAVEAEFKCPACLGMLQYVEARK